jgi:glc operon protein GlcG
MYRRSTRVFQDAVSKGSVGLLTLSGMSAASGGLPIMKDGKVIGAIGTSGVTSDEDEQVSKAGLAGM